MDISKIEIWKSFPGVSYAQVRKNARILEKSSGLLVASIEDLKTWKAAQGRQKDIEDLKMMDRI